MGTERFAGAYAAPIAAADAAADAAAGIESFHGRLGFGVFHVIADEILVFVVVLFVAVLKQRF